MPVMSIQVDATWVDSSALDAGRGVTFTSGGGNGWSHAMQWRMAAWLMVWHSRQTLIGASLGASALSFRRPSGWSMCLTPPPDDRHQIGQSGYQTYERQADEVKIVRRVIRAAKRL